MDDLTAKHLEDDKAMGLPVSNEGTFRVVDGEGHIEVVDPTGPPGASAYPSRDRADLVKLAKLLGVKSTGTKDEIVRALVELDENPTAVPPEMREFEADVNE